MNLHKIDNKSYYLAKSIIEENPLFFKGCHKRVRDILKVKNVPKVSYTFANKRNGKWTKINDLSNPANKDKLFISKQWYDKNVTEDNTLVNMVDSLPLLDLNDDEKFYDGEYVYDIETRGERTFDKCYFLSTDVGYAFGIKDINTKIRSSDYIEQEDYVIFFDTKNRSSMSTDKKYYLTYHGILKCLYRARLNSTKKFITWATQTLFTLQMGTVESKTELINSCIGTDLTLFKSVMSCYPSKISCVYLIALGTVQDLKNDFSINKRNDSSIVCKFGKSNDMERRVKEHDAVYKRKSKNVQITVLTFVLINETYISNAESDLNDIFTTGYDRFGTEDENELVIIDKKDINNIKRMYRSLEEDYGKDFKEIKALHESEKHQYELKISNLEKDKLVLENELLKLKLKNV